MAWLPLPQGRDPLAVVRCQSAARPFELDGAWIVRALSPCLKPLFCGPSSSPALKAFLLCCELLANLVTLQAIRPAADAEFQYNASATTTAQAKCQMPIRALGSQVHIVASRLNAIKSSKSQVRSPFLTGAPASCRLVERKTCANNVWSAGILPARGTKTCANNVWSAGILPARGTKTCANNVWSAGILPAPGT
jgi:hypothetical protein